MKNVVVTVLGVLILAIAMATAAFAAQTADPSVVRSVFDPLSAAMRMQTVSGQVGGIALLPSTTTGGGADGIVLAVLGVGAAIGGAALIRKAATD